MSRKRPPIKIALPERSKSTKKVAPAKVAAWADEERARIGIYQDPSNPARFHRVGRGGTAERTVRRLTVYVSDELAIALDVHRAKADRSPSRSEVMELALRQYLEREGLLDQ